MESTRKAKQMNGKGKGRGRSSNCEYAYSRQSKDAYWKGNPLQKVNGKERKGQGRKGKQRKEKGHGHGKGGHVICENAFSMPSKMHIGKQATGQEKDKERKGNNL